LNNHQSIDNSHSPGETSILLVEDNPVNQKIVVLLLRALGLKADLAFNGLEALKALANKKYSIILMDCHMPEMDGFEATKAIRQLETSAQSRIPIIAVTALAMQGDEEKCLAAGMDDYISKPIDTQIFQAKIKRWLLKEAG